MNTSNIDDFNLLVGKIFAELYASFPVAKFLSLDTFQDNETLQQRIEEQRAASPASFELGQALRHDQPLIFFHATISWLETAGFIHVGKQMQESYHYGFADVVLTNQGLIALNQVPGSLVAPEHKESLLGQLLRQAVNDSQKELIKASVKAAFIGLWSLRSHVGL